MNVQKRSLSEGRLAALLRQFPQRTLGGEIHRLLPRVMRDIGCVAKSQSDSQGRFRFRSIDDALNAVQPVLVQHEVCVSFTCRDHHLSVQRASGGIRCRATLLLELRFWAADGSYVASVAAGEGYDEDGDKATGKAMSNAMKYALFFGLMIPAGAAAGDCEPPVAAASNATSQVSS